MKILITGFFGVKNLGDDIMLKKFCEETLEQNIDAEITLLLTNGSDIGFTLSEAIKVIKLDKIPKGKTLLFRWWLSRQYDALFWIGGTCFTENAGDGFYPYMKAFKERKKVFGYIGVGIGDLISQERIQKLQYLLDNASLITFRDEKSYEYAKQLSNNPELYKCEDLVWLACNGMSRSNSNKKTLLISWRDFSIYYENEVESNAIYSLVEFVKEIHYEFDEILIQPMGNDIDIKRNREIYEFLSKDLPEDKIRYSNSTSISDRIKAITSSTLNITGRLHSLFFSELYSINTIAIGYDNKIQKLLDSIGRSEDLIYPQNFSSKELKRIYNLNKVSDTEINYQQCYEKSLENILHFKRFVDSR